MGIKKGNSLDKLNLVKEKMISKFGNIFFFSSKYDTHRVSSKYNYQF